MSSNSAFHAVGNLGWKQGFANLFQKENYLWWRTSRWWVQVLLWMAIANGILFMVIGVAPKMENTSGSSTNTQTTQSTAKAGENQDPLDIYGISVFIKMAGITIGIGVVILGQGTLIDERNNGTAAWVLSKPVSRTAVVLSKIVSYSLGILGTMVIIQGCIAYLIVFFITGTALPVLPYAGALGSLFLALVFWLTLTVMLSTLSNNRGLVIGIPLILILGSSLFVEIIPWINDIMPWNLTTTISATRPALALLLMTGQSLPTLMPLFASLTWCLLFTCTAIWRLQREEF